MKKMLYILNIANRVNNFSYTSMKAAQELGFDYHIAGNWKYANDQERIEDEKKYGIHIYQIDFIRTPYHPGNIKAYYQLKEIVEREKFDVIHCNTPIGGVIGRLLGKSCKVPTVIYQAHGFHFYKGAPIINWMIYYPIERWLAHYTDTIITINQEDLERAKSFKLRNHGKVYYVPGVGIDKDQFKPRNYERNCKRAELGLLENDIAVISAGDLIERNNYKVSIEAIANTNNPRIHYYICGEGNQREELEKTACKLGMSDRVHFLGFRKDMKQLMWAADIFLFTTLQEGLPRSLLEAMASGLPCVVSNIRGNTDLIDNKENGFLIESDDVNGFTNALITLASDYELRQTMGKKNMQRILDFDISASEAKLASIYKIAGEGYLTSFIPSWVRKRHEIGVPIDAFLLISSGDINKNKNNKVVINAVKDFNDVYYVLCGDGPMVESLREISNNRIRFLGYRTDIVELLAAADLYVLPSYREGLSRSLMEGMAMGLPCLASNIRGNRDLLSKRSEYLINPSDTNSWRDAIQEISRENRRNIIQGERNAKTIENYSLQSVKEALKSVYIGCK